MRHIFRHDQHAIEQEIQHNLHKHDIAVRDPHLHLPSMTILTPALLLTLLKATFEQIVEITAL